MVPFLSIPVVIFNSTMTAEHEHSTVHIATGMRYKIAKPSSESVEAPQKISSRSFDLIFSDFAFFSEFLFNLWNGTSHTNSNRKIKL